MPCLSNEINHGSNWSACGVFISSSTPEPELQRIASWVLTRMEGEEERIETLIGRLWLRFGREDLVLSSLSTR